MIGSNLVTKQIPAHTNNYKKTRSGSKLTDFILHHMAANSTIESCGALWQNPAKGCSSTYGVQGKSIGQYVSEDDEPYTSSNRTADRKAITIEIANAPEVTGKTYAETINKGDALGWPVTAESLETTINLMVDCMKRNNYAPLVVNENLKWHSMFAATVCPGPYLMSKMQHIADECNKRAFPAPETNTSTLYGVVKQVIALSDKEKAKAYAAKLNTQGETDAYYKVIEIK